MEVERQLFAGLKFDRKRFGKDIALFEVTSSCWRLTGSWSILALLWPTAFPLLGSYCFLLQVSTLGPHRER